MPHATVTEHEQPLHEFVSTAMSTTVSVQIVGAHPNASSLAADALDWFRLVEAACSRFDASSDLSQLCRTVSVWVPISPLLFEVLRDAWPGTVARHLPGWSATAAMESTVRASLVALM